jgi:ATP-dependent DNA helicase RecQ
VTTAGSLSRRLADHGQKSAKYKNISIACYYYLYIIGFNNVNSVDSSIASTLKTVFGFDQFRDGQAEIITKILEGKSALAVFPTGSGKSLCYQLSALHLPGLTLVISPLIALMKDQIDFLKARNIPAARLDSTIDLEEIRRTDAALRAGRLKLLYVAPERFSNERFIQKLRQLQISLVVIDEAHCISEWGHNFRPEYLKLAQAAHNLGINRVLTLTATATPAVANDICRGFKIADDAFVHTGFYRSNLTLRVTFCDSRGKTEVLLDRLKNRPPGPVIVYVTLQRTAEMVASSLSKKGFSARHYHAGLNGDERAQVQDWFMKSSNAIVVATIAFGMGIDKSNIRYVYHYNLPKSLENYSQEIGRAGRDGQDSICEMLASVDDVTVLENFTYGDTPDKASIDAIIDWVLAKENQFDVSVYELSRTHDVRPLVIETLLTYLELEEVVEATEPFYNEYQFVLLKSAKEILSRFDAERANFVRGVFANAIEHSKWSSIDINEVAGRLSSARARIIKALMYLEEQGDLQLKVAGLRQGYRKKPRFVDLTDLKAKMVERFEARERNDVSRVRQVAQLAEHPGCIVGYLLQYFGEELGRDCGHCESCLGNSRRTFLTQRTISVPTLDHQFSVLRHNYPDALSSPRQIARFLCGLNSPLLTQTKLNRHADFGVLAEIPFQNVMQAGEKLLFTGTAT